MVFIQLFLLSEPQILFSVAKITIVINTNVINIVLRFSQNDCQIIEYKYKIHYKMITKVQQIETQGETRRASQKEKYAVEEIETEKAHLNTTVVRCCLTLERKKFTQPRILKVT